MSRISDSELERMIELVRQVPDDPLALAQWARRVQVDCQLAFEVLRDLDQEKGGSFADRLRQLIEKQVMIQLNGRAVLTSFTKEVSLSVHVAQSSVFVDVRLQIGTAV